MKKDLRKQGAIWEKAVREAFRGDAFLVVDKPPVENPAAKESVPVQLARRLIELFDKAEEEILIISAYLIPSIDLEGRSSELSSAASMCVS
jgi:putative cardiolipin synthase